MKKQYVAARACLMLAAASFVSTNAQAQSNTTIYGRLDIYYANYLGDGKRMNVIDPGGISGARLGFKGSEDLGNGLQAVYLLEFGSLKIDTDSGINGTRESYVGLKGHWGTLIGGYVYSPSDDFNSGFDGLSNSGLLSARSNMLNDGGFSTKVDDTFKNSVAYISPEFKGLRLRGVFGLGEQTTGPKENKYALGAEYERGPFKTSVIYHYVHNREGTEVDEREVALGGGYDFGLAKLLGTVNTMKASGGSRDNVWALGAQVPTGRGSVRLSYAVLDESKKSGNADAKGWTVAYFYDLSKRTTLYTGYHMLDNGSNAMYKHERMVVDKAGSDAELFAVGMRHKF